MTKQSWMILGALIITGLFTVGCDRPPAGEIHCLRQGLGNWLAPREGLIVWKYS